MRRFLAPLLLALLAPWTAAAQSQIDPFGEVVGEAQALSGDVVVVQGTTVRLYGLDAPDLGQQCSNARGRQYDCGAAATNVMNRLVGGREVSCSLFSMRSDGTNVGACSIEGHDLGGLLLLYGWAVAARDTSFRYQGLEAQAQIIHSGMWSGHFQRPNVWRQNNPG